jgi:type I restriction-modification system DNA methylase subunit
MTQIKLKTKIDADFIMEMMSVFEKFEHQNKKYLSYLNTERKGDEAVVYEKIIIPLFTDVLNYDKHKDFNPQSTLSTGTIDNWIKNRESSPLIALEALRSNASQAEFIEHRQRLLSGYFDELGAKYAVLTNGVVFEVWNRIAEKSKGLFVKIDFREIYTKFIEKGIRSFVDEDWRKLSILMTLKKENQYLDVKYIYPEPQLDISEELHFNNFLSALQERMEEVKEDVLAKFKYLKGEYQECSEHIKQYEERTFLKIRKRYERAQKFIQSFETWQKTSPTNTTPEAFCLETMYVFFNRILLIRICEDKGIIPRKISNGGIKKYIEYRGYIKFSQVDYKALLKEAYQIMNQFYPHLFQIDIFDWYEIDNDILLRVLFTFNPYNFNKVNRDVLGKLYEKYLDREERKRLGEFYTPEEVIDYILDAVDYTPESEIEGTKLLDPACGSGGFLVRATNIFVEKLKNHGFNAETILRKLQESIYGFDINPFACHLAETNLFFQVINLIHQAKKNNPDFVMDKFNIYQTDSLRIPEEKVELSLFPGEISEYLIDTDIVKRIKLKQGEFKDGFDFVVGNPPYGIIFDKKEKNSLKIIYSVLVPNCDIYTAFIQFALRLCNQQGVFGFIVPNTYIHGPYFEKLRKLILSKACIKEIVDFGSFRVFDDPNVFNSILILKKNILLKEKEKNILYHQRLRYSSQLYNKANFETFKVIQGTLSAATWRISEPLENKAKKRSYPIDKISEVKDVGLNYWTVGRGKKRGGSIADRILYRGKQEYNLDIPFLKGRDIERYSLSFSNHWLRHNYKELLNSKDIFRFSPEYFTLPKKIVYRQTSDTIKATIDANQYYVDKTVHIVVLREKYFEEFNLKYILALLNSRFLAYLYNKIVHEKRRVFAQVKTFNIKQLPIKLASQKIQQRFADLVEQIFEINKNLPSLEAKIFDIQKLFEDFDFPFGDLADIPGIRVELRDRIGKPKIKREELKVYLDRKSYIDCKDENQANYIELYLESLGDTLRGKTSSEVVDLIRIPKSPAQLQNILQKRQELLNQIEGLKHRQDEIDKEIDEKVYKLYGLTEEEIKIIKESD